MPILYDDKGCSNSTFWYNLRSINVLIFLAATIILIVAITLGIIYLVNRKKDKKKAKKLFIAFIIILVFSIGGYIGSFLLGHYINTSTKDLEYCWEINK